MLEVWARAGVAAGSKARLARTRNAALRNQRQRPLSTTSTLIKRERWSREPGPARDSVRLALVASRAMRVGGLRARAGT